MKKMIFLFAVTMICLRGNSQVCPDTSILINDQHQIDSFALWFPNCTEIVGNLIIDSGVESIMSLEGLEQIRRIGGDLIIRNNLILDNLLGLDSLMQISGNLTIRNNDGLSSLTGLGALRFVGEDVLIRKNNALSDLSGLKSLNTVVETMKIIRNDSLRSLDGLDVLEQCGGVHLDSNLVLRDIRSLSGLYSIKDTLRLRHLPELISLSGLDSLRTVGGNLNLASLPKLTNVSALDRLESVGRGFQLKNCIKLISIRNSFSNLEEIGWHMRISQNTKLRLTETFKKLRIVGGRLFIYDNPSIFEMPAFFELDTIGGDLFIKENVKLGGLDNLSQLNYIGGSLYVEDNRVLTALDGLDNLSVEGLDRLIIRSNAMLSVCNVPAVCAYIDLNKPGLVIKDNAENCNNPDEVSIQCRMTATDDMRIKSLRLFPNPANDYIAVFGLESLDMGRIFDISGRVVLEFEGSDAIDIQKLKPGVYFLQIGVYVEKFVKN